MIQKKNLLFYIFFLTLYSLEFSKTLQLTEAPGQYPTSVHYVGVFVIGIGFLSFYASRRLFDSISVQKWILMSFNLIYTAGMLILLYLPGIPYIIWLIDLALGYLGGMVYYDIAVALGRTDYVGRVGMCGQSLSILLQILLTKSPVGTWATMAMLIVGFVAITCLMLFPPADWMFEEMLPYARETPTWNRELKRRLTRLLCIVILADAYGCLLEISWTTVQETGGIDMYSLPRLSMIAGYVLAGVFADYKQHRYLDTALLVVLSLGMSGVYMADQTVLRLCIFYLTAGFIVLYMNIKFWHLAPCTKHPEFWAGFGRILFVFEGLWSGLFIRFLSGQTFYYTVFITVLFAVILCFVVREAEQKAGGEWILFGREAVGGESDAFPSPDTERSPQADEEAARSRQFLAYIVQYRLTPRESDVLKELLRSDASMKVLAENLGISERMLYRYMKQLYEKTGTESRAGLVKAYYENKASSAPQD